MTTTQTTPVVGNRYRAETLTATAQTVIVQVTQVERETRHGWLVWGYRQYPNRRRMGKPSYPRRYLIPRIVESDA